MLLAHLQSTLGQVLGLADGVPVDGQQGLFDMGMDSLTAMEFRTRLQTSLATSLPATLTFDYGTLDALADFLMREAFDAKAYPPATEPRKAEDRQADMLALVERISDDEVGALLEAKLLTL
jgi:myxalamid-type polyketide synthase MxaB